MNFRMERWQGALAVALLLGSLPQLPKKQPSVWPKDIYSAEENAPASENPGDETEGAPAQTVDLNNPDIDWSQLDPATATAGNAPADPKARRARGTAPRHPGRRRTKPMARPHCRSSNR